MQQFLTVSELNAYLGTLVQTDEILCNFWLKGEISGFRYYRQSGHMYFTLKDSESAVSCVMFKSRAQKLDFEPEDGLDVLIRGYLAIYGKQGKYQIYVQEMQPYGLGGLHLRLEQLKKKLQEVGYFRTGNEKTKIPEMVSCVGVVTSQDGAAFRDILKVIRQRHRGCRIILAHSAVQGEDAPVQLARGVRLLNEHARVQVIILGRGGGSFEDLMAFNSEEVVRAIFDSDIPVISAVGHEVDFSLADLAADLRAATPTQAASLAVPDMNQIERETRRLQESLIRAMERTIERREEALDRVMMKKVWKEPAVLLSEKRTQLENLQQRMEQSTRTVLKEKQHRYCLALNALDKLSPLKVMQRGYALVYKDRQPVKEAGSVKIGEEIQVTLYRGSLKARVTGKENGYEENEI